MINMQLGYRQLSTTQNDSRSTYRVAWHVRFGRHYWYSPADRLQRDLFLSTTALEVWLMCTYTMS